MRHVKWSCNLQFNCWDTFPNIQVNIGICLCTPFSLLKHICKLFDLCYRALGLYDAVQEKKRDCACDTRVQPQNTRLVTQNRHENKCSSDRDTDTAPEWKLFSLYMLWFDCILNTTFWLFCYYFSSTHTHTNLKC